MKKITLKQCFEQALPDLKIDAKLARKLYLYRVGIITKSKDTMEFFGGNLLGTHRIWFKDNLYKELYEDVLGADMEVVKTIVRKAETINHTFKISGDITNLLCMYLIHLSLNAKGLSSKQQNAMAYDVAMIFFIRCLCIIISDQFNFVADPKVVQQAYANLSMKFMIKQLGSWNKVMDHRSKLLVNPKTGIHYKALLAFDDDDDIVYSINDSQGAIKSYVKFYYAELINVAQGGGGVGVSKAVGTDLEGDDALMEKEGGAEKYVKYLKDTLVDKHSFLRDDILDVAVSANTNASKRSVRDILEWMTNNYMAPQHFKLIDSFSLKTITLAYHFMGIHIEPTRRRDYVYVVKKLKDVFLSSRNPDPDLKEVRDLGEKVVKLSLGKVSSSLVNASRTAVIMYLIARIFSGAR